MHNWRGSPVSTGFCQRLEVAHQPFADLPSLSIRAAKGSFSIVKLGRPANSSSINIPALRSPACSTWRGSDFQLLQSRKTENTSLSGVRDATAAQFNHRVAASSAVQKKAPRLAAPSRR